MGRHVRHRLRMSHASVLQKHSCLQIDAPYFATKQRDKKWRKLEDVSTTQSELTMNGKRIEEGCYKITISLYVWEGFAGRPWSEYSKVHLSGIEKERSQLSMGRPKARSRFDEI